LQTLQAISLAIQGETNFSAMSDNKRNAETRIAMSRENEQELISHFNSGEMCDKPLVDYFTIWNLHRDYFTIASCILESTPSTKFVLFYRLH